MWHMQFSIKKTIFEREKKLFDGKPFKNKIKKLVLIIKFGVSVYF
jgi:hypothetical protein